LAVFLSAGENATAAGVANCAAASSSSFRERQVHLDLAKLLRRLPCTVAAGDGKHSGMQRRRAAMQAGYLASELLWSH
jgi:hypothetical protein